MKEISQKVNRSTLPGIDPCPVATKVLSTTNGSRWGQQPSDPWKRSQLGLIWSLLPPGLCLSVCLSVCRVKDTVGMPMATCKLLLRQRLYTLSNNRWNSISTWTKTLLQCSREDIFTLLNALTGHCLIGTHALRLGLSYHDFCRSCKQIDEEESIEHLLSFCPAHNLKRLQTIGSYTLPNLAAIQGVSIHKLLCFLRRTEYFAKANNPWAREKDLIRDHVVSQGAQCGLSVGISISNHSNLT